MRQRGRRWLFDEPHPQRIDTTDLVESQLLRPLAKDKEHRVDDVRLSGAIGTNDRREPLVEWSNLKT
jgi:hypothetical protein